VESDALSDAIGSIGMKGVGSMSVNVNVTLVGDDMRNVGRFVGIGIKSSGGLG
jgi:hypothetical protein